MEGTIEQENYVVKKWFKYILTLLLYVVVFGILALIIWWTNPFNISAEQQLQVCEEEACNVTAVRLFNSINLSVNPCDNFYQFACGGYISHAKIPRGKKKISLTLELEEKVQIAQKNILENMTQEFFSLPKSYSLIESLYTHCMDTDKVESDGLTQARNLFLEAGAWPFQNASPPPDSWTFLDTQSKLKGLSLATNSLVKVSLESNSSGVIFFVQPPELELPASEFFQGMMSPRVVQYLEHMVDMALLYGVQEKKANTTMKRILDLECNLAEYTLQNLLQLPSMSWVPWTSLLSTMVPDSYEIPMSQPVTVINPEYIMKLGELLPTKSSMGIALSSLYVTNFLHQDVKTSAETLVDNIHQELIDNIQESTLDEPARSLTAEEARSIKTVVGYPDGLADIENVEAYYKDLTPNKENFHKAMMDIKKWHHDAVIATSVKEKVMGNSVWEDFGDLSVPKASFSVSQKSVTINAGLLQTPLFSPDHPLYINYGTIGYLVAHHFTHTLDNQSTKSSSAQITYKDGLKVAYMAYRKVADQLTSPEPVLPNLQTYSPGQLFMISMANMLCVKQGSSVEAGVGGTSDNTPSPIEIKINGLVKNSEDFRNLFGCKYS